MKLSFVVQVPEKGEGLQDFHRKLKLLKDLGYEGVELAIRNTKRIERKKVKELIKESGLEVPAIATGKVFLAEGLSFCHPSDSKRKRASSRIKEHIKFASFFGAKVVIGLIRGNLEKNMTREDAYQMIVDALRECSDFASRYQVKLVLEAINRYEADFVHTLEEAKEIIEKVGCSNISILADTFHMNIEERWAGGSITDFGDLIGHVHIADSNRMIPGEGHFDFRETICSLADADYNGFLSVELVPVKPDFDTAAKESIEYLRDVLR